MNSYLNFVLNQSGITSIICKNPNMNETRLYKTKCTSLETYPQNTEVYDIPDRELEVWQVFGKIQEHVDKENESNEAMHIISHVKEELNNWDIQISYSISLFFYSRKKHKFHGKRRIRQFIIISALQMQFRGAMHPE